MNLEEDLISTVHQSIVGAIKTKLEGYNSPLDKLIKESVERHDGEIRNALDASIKGALQGDFALALQDACTRKLAKVLISKMEGELEKRVGELRQSPDFRARLTVVVDDLVKSMSAKS